MEEIYQNAVKLFHAADCMTACPDKILIYRKTLARFKQIEEYKDSKKYCRACRAQAKLTRLQIKENAYKAALNRFNKAKNVQDLLAVEADFRKLDDFQDSKNMVEKCIQKQAIYEKKSLRGSIMQIILAVCVIGMLLASLTTPFKYLRARAYNRTGMYDMAIKLYTKLDNYKDSEARLRECKYLYGLKLKEEQNYVDARQAFVAAKSFEDSEAQEANMEQLIIDTKHPGKSIVIGGVSWIILEKTEHEALLIKSSHFEDVPFHNSLQDVTWENSDLRKWLNSDFLDQTFTPEERANIQLTNVKMDDNDMYGIDGGNDTEDHIFLLSSKEAEKYSDLLGASDVTSWLRTPGSNPQTASFLSDDNIVMDYGYLVNSSGFTARPVMWYTYN